MGIIEIDRGLDSPAHLLAELQAMQPSCWPVVPGPVIRRRATLFSWTLQTFLWGSTNVSSSPAPLALVPNISKKKCNVSWIPRCGQIPPLHQFDGGPFGAAGSL